MGDQNLCAFTIVANNYLAQALTLYHSMHLYNNRVDFYVLIVDPQPREVAYDELPFKVLYPEVLGLSHFDDMAFRYTVLELSTALKPSVFRYLLRQGYNSAWYFDPDIQIFRSLESLWEKIESAPIVVIPHITKPIPEDGHHPNEQDILKAGSFNLGFLGVTNNTETKQLMRWWEARLARYCEVNVSEGLFVDQRWIDLLPGLTSAFSIVRDVSYNVAYWNLHERKLDYKNDLYLVNGQPLGFFHYSGFDLNNPTILSKHQTRHTVIEGSALEKLLQQYRIHLLEHGYAHYQKLAYGYGFFSNGCAIDSVMRYAYRYASDDLQSRWGNPFDVEKSNSFWNWLHSPIRIGSSITQYSLALWKNRPDLQKVYPNIYGESEGAYKNWLNDQANGGSLQEIPLNLLVHTLAITSMGINFAGYLKGELGIGEAARGLIRASQSVNIPISLTNYSVGLESRQADPTFDDFDGSCPYPINIVGVNADQFHIFAQAVGSKFFDGKYTIGMWFWELPEFPHYPEAVSLVDEVWAGSRFIQESISSKITAPVIRMPIPIVIDPSKLPLYSRTDFGLPHDDFLFMFMFDFRSVFARKNPIAVIDAFKKAFRPNENASLLIKCINSNFDPDNYQLLCDVAKGHRIIIQDGYLSRTETLALVNLCDAYVSLHRSEGLGLTIAEAMALGKPIIATAWSGNMDFTFLNNSWLVDYKLVSLKQNEGPYIRGSHWAEPDLDHAARQMRKVFSNDSEVRHKVKNGQQLILEEYSLEAVGKRITDRLTILSALPKLSKSESKDQDHEIINTSGPDFLASLNRDIDINRIPVSSRVLGGQWFKRLIRKSTFWLFQGLFQRVQTFNTNMLASIHQALYLIQQTEKKQRTLESNLKSLTAEQEDIKSYVVTQLTNLMERVSIFDRTFSTLEQTLSTFAKDREVLAKELLSVAQDGQQTRQKLHNMTTVMDDMKRTVGSLSSSVENLETNVSSIYKDLRPQVYTNQVKDEDIRQGTWYHGFEEVFRGTPDILLTRSTVYIEPIKSHQPVLDVGCGRGEFLSLLGSLGIASRGVDIDISNVEQAQNSGLIVEHDDAIAFLMRMPEKQLGTIFSSQVIEHLDAKALETLITESFRVLKPGGLFIAETPNPYHLASFRFFHLDPTHQQPLYPEFLSFCCRRVGFDNVEIRFLPCFGDDRLNLIEPWDYCDYYVIATRPWFF